MRALTVYIHRTNADRGALAAEITPADIAEGRGGAVGDFFVVEPGGRPQWTERDSFHAEWEKLASPSSEKVADLGPFIDEARAAIHALAPAPAPASSSDTAAADPLAARNLEAQNARLETLEELFRSLEQDFLKVRGNAITGIVERLEAAESRIGELYGKLDDVGNGTTAQFTSLTERVEQLEGFDAAGSIAAINVRLAALEAEPAAAAEDDDAGEDGERSSAKQKRLERKRGGRS